MKGTTEIVNITAVQELVSAIEKQGDSVVISPDAAARIANFKRAMKLMQDAEALLKTELKAALRAFSASSMRGQDLTISLGAARGSSRFTVQEGYKHDWSKQKVTWVPDVDKIESYIAEHGAAPEGVVVNEVEPTVIIRVK